MLSTQNLRVNIVSLGTLQALNFALTLSTLPYLTRILGVEGWGRVVFVQMVINYMIWIANWGFYLGATQKVAANRGNRVVMSHIFVTTWASQWWLTCLLAILLAISINLIPILINDKILYLSGAGLLLGNVFTPLWYLNGLEKIRESALIQMAIKLLALPFIFTMISEESGMVTYLVINSSCAIVVGMLTIGWIGRTGAIHWHAPHLHDIFSSLRQEYPLFISSFWANLKGALIPTVLGIIGGATELGYYNLADRARSAGITILHPITHALFPRMCHLFQKDHIQALRLLKRSGAALLALSFSTSLVLFTFSSDVLRILGGINFQSGVSILMWLAFTPVFATITSFIIHQILIPAGAAKTYNKAMFLTLLINAGLVVPTVALLGAQGAAISSFFTELFAAIYLTTYVWRHRLLAAGYV